MNAQQIRVYNFNITATRARSLCKKARQRVVNNAKQWWKVAVIGAWLVNTIIDWFESLDTSWAWPSWWPWPWMSRA